MQGCKQPRTTAKTLSAAYFIWNTLVDVSLPHRMNEVGVGRRSTDLSKGACDLSAVVSRVVEHLHNDVFQRVHPAFVLRVDVLHRARQILLRHRPKLRLPLGFDALPLRRALIE